MSAEAEGRVSAGPSRPPTNVLNNGSGASAAPGSSGPVSDRHDDLFKKTKLSKNEEKESIDA